MAHEHPFGPKNTVTLQTTENTLLSKHQAYATAYLDNIAVFSDTWQEHLIHLVRIFQVLGRSRLKVSPEKCQVAQAYIHYLRHVVGSGAHGSDTGSNKEAAIKI